MTARLIEFSDREFLHIVNDIAPLRWVTTHEIAERITGATDGDHFKAAVRGAGSRLAWMRRYGVIERDPETRKWRVTENGMKFINGSMRPRLRQSLESADEFEMVESLKRLSEHYQRVSYSGSHLMRREWQRGTMRK